MHFEGSVPIKASREKVWAFVIDPGPGRPVRARASRRSRSSTPTHFKATAKVGIGFINARFNVEHGRSPSWSHPTGR